MSKFTEHTQLTRTEDLPIPSKKTEDFQNEKIDPKDNFRIPKNAKALLIISENIDTVLFLNQENVPKENQKVYSWEEEVDGMTKRFVLEDDSSEYMATVSLTKEYGAIFICLCHAQRHTVQFSSHEVMNSAKYEIVSKEEAKICVLKRQNENKERKDFNLRVSNKSIYMIPKGDELLIRVS